MLRRMSNAARDGQHALSSPSQVLLTVEGEVPEFIGDEAEEGQKDAMRVVTKSSVLQGREKCA